jgi:hypothetical protein
LLRLADEALSRQGRMLRALDLSEHEAAIEEPVIPFDLEV